MAGSQDLASWQALWARIDALMRVKVPKVFRGLRGPITAAGLAWLHSQARRGGVALHPAIEATFRAHDGAKGERASLIALMPFAEQDAWANHCSFHSTWISKSELAIWRDALGTHEDEGGWPDRWLPIGRDGGGNAVVLSLDTGAIFAWDHERGDPSPSTTLGDFLVTLADELERDRIGEDDGEPVRGDFGATARAPSVPKLARAFVQLLVEKSFAELTPTDALLAALDDALSKKTARARKKAVSQVLYGHDDVAEVFAPDDVLEVLIDEFG